MTRKTGEDYINGQASSPICTKENSSRARETEEELSGGQMAAGIKANSETEYKVGMEFYIEMVDILSMKDLGIMECSMAKEHSTSRTDKSTKGRLRKTSSTAMVFFIRTIR